MSQRHNDQKNDKADRLDSHASCPYGALLNPMQNTPAPQLSSGSGCHIAIRNDLKSLLAAIRRAQTGLFKFQHPEGYWLGELEANSTLYSDYVAFMHWSGEIDSDLQRKCAEQLLVARGAEGGWSIYPGGPPGIVQ